MKNKYFESPPTGICNQKEIGNVFSNFERLVLSFFKNPIKKSSQCMKKNIVE